MKEELLKNMIHIVDDMVKSYKTDFYSFDLHTIVKDKLKSFVWFVRKSGTYLLPMDKDWYLRNMEKEYERFAFMKNGEKYNITFALDEFSKADVSTFMVVDEEIKLITDSAEMEKIFKEINDEVQQHVIEKYPEEHQHYNKKMPVRFSCREVRQSVSDLIRTDEGKQLLKLLKGFHEYNRTAKNEYVLISGDFADKSFTFARITNEQCQLYGGIIYYNHQWNTHT